MRRRSPEFAQAGAQDGKGRRAVDRVGDEVLEAGLVEAGEVAGGALSVTLGRRVGGDPAATKRLFERMYLLNRAARRGTPAGGES